MLDLEQFIRIDAETIASANLCNIISDDDLLKIGGHVSESFNSDYHSCDKWRERSSAAMDFAMQVQKDKNFPWEGCSNVIFPLITIGAMQFHARAYPKIVHGKEIVQCSFAGDDPNGDLRKQADKISKHMSWQVLVQDEAWDEQEDRALLNVPIVGCAWKKSYYDASKGHNTSELVLAKDFVIDYWAKSVESARTKTHIVYLSRNSIHERIMRGTYRDIREESWYSSDAHPVRNAETEEEDNRAGKTQPSSTIGTPFTFYEHHCYLDLDGDGYEEPYIVTFEATSKCVVRIVTRFDRIEDVEFTDSGDIISIRPMEYFTKIPFIPSPDGGIMDIGFGTLLGPLNESVNTAINQLFDAGTMANTAGGFLARGAKVRGGIFQFSPFEWNRVDSTGGDLAKSIFPLPVREPSSVLFNLLGLIINYTNRISGSTDIMVGENPGQNTPAETSRSMVEQGQKIYSAIFKRIWRSLKQEFNKLYTLNAIYLPQQVSFGGPGQYIGREDYTMLPGMITPVADPNIASEGDRYNRAVALKQASAGNPGYNHDEVEKQFLTALGISDIPLVYPGLEKAGQQPPDVKLQIAQIQAQSDANQLEYEKLKFVAQLQEDHRVNTAKIVKLISEAQKSMADIEGDNMDRKINAFNSAIGALRENNSQLEARIERVLANLNRKEAGNESGTNDAASGNIRRVANASNNSGGNAPSGSPAVPPQGYVGGGQPGGTPM